MSTTSSPTALSSLIRRPEGAFLPLLKKAGQLRALHDTLIAEFDSSIAEHCRVVNLRGSVLVLAVDSPAWATRLRFQLSELLSRFRLAGNPGLASIELVISHRDKDLAPIEAQLPKPVDHRPPAPVREKIAKILEEDATGLPADLGLRLRKLANSYTKSI